MNTIVMVIQSSGMKNDEGENLYEVVSDDKNSSGRQTIYYTGTKRQCKRFLYPGTTEFTTTNKNIKVKYS